jgi:hypothetical protein
LKNRTLNPIAGLFIDCVRAVAKSHLSWHPSLRSRLAAGDWCWKKSLAGMSRKRQRQRRSVLIARAGLRTRNISMRRDQGGRDVPMRAAPYALAPGPRLTRAMTTIASATANAAAFQSVEVRLCIAGYPK